MRRRDRRCRTRKGPSQPDRAGDASEAAASRGMSGSAYRQHLPVRGEVPRDPSCRGMRLALAAGARRWRPRAWRVGRGPCCNTPGGSGVGGVRVWGGVWRGEGSRGLRGRSGEAWACEHFGGVFTEPKRTSQPSLRSVGRQLGLDVVRAKFSNRICVGDRGQGGFPKIQAGNGI